MEFKLSRNAIMTFMLKNKQSMINQDGFFFYSNLVENIVKMCKSDFQFIQQ